MEEKLYIEVGNLEDMIYDAVEKLVNKDLTVQEIVNVLGKSTDWFYKNNKFWGFTPAKYTNAYNPRVQGVPANIREVVRADYVSGLHYSEICSKYGLHRSTVYNICQGLTHQRKLELTEQQFEEIKEVYATSGMSYKEIAKLYDVSEASIRRIVIGKRVYKPA